MASQERVPRWDRLLQLLADHGELTVTRACAELGVSEATVRRDFNNLAAQQLATRTHGGVVATAVTYQLPARYRSAAQDDSRRLIAEVAAGLVTPGSVVGFNGGTTTTLAARCTATRSDLAESGERPAVTVVTNALNIASEMVLRPWVRCVGLGGVARRESYEQTGPLAAEVMSRLWLDLLVLGVDGFTAATGATCRHDDEAGINALMVSRAEQVAIVASGDKLGRSAFARICEASEIDLLITDATAPAAAVTALREIGVRVTVVGEPSA